MSNFLSLESVLVGHLRAVLPAAVKAAGLPAVHVLAKADLAGVIAEKQLVPAVSVLYRGYSVDKSNRSDKRAALITQRWVVVVTTKNVAALKTGEASRNAAGELADLVLNALMGHKPAGFASPLELANTVDGGDMDGFSYLPLGFECEFVKRVPAHVA